MQDTIARNAIYLGEKRGEDKGRPFRARFLQAGLVKYDFGVCLLKKETIDKFINTFIDCPVIINHKDEITETDKMGEIKNIWFSPEDSWFWCSGNLDDEASELVEKGYNVSCQYRITEYIENNENKLHNGNPYDKEILNGIFEHLAIVENPRYEDAYIAVNAILATDEDKWVTIRTKEIKKAQNGWITLDKTDDEGNPIKIYIEGYFGQAKKERERKSQILENFEGGETKYDFSHTRAEISNEQKTLIKNVIGDIYKRFMAKPLAQVEVRTLGGGALGLCTSGKNASIVGLDSSIYSGKYTQADWDKSVKGGFHPKTDEKDLIKKLLTHELGHAISVNNGNKEFWEKAESIRKEYLKDVKKKDLKHPDFISDYARANKYEFVAEAFAQGQLSKKYGKYTKQVINLMDEHFAKNKQLKIAATNESENKNDAIIWEEEFGGGYPIDEEAYEELKKKQDEDSKQEQKKASNSYKNLEEDIKDTLYTKLEKEIDKYID